VTVRYSSRPSERGELGKPVNGRRRT